MRACLQAGELPAAAAWVGRRLHARRHRDREACPGTFSLDITRGSHPSRSPDVAVSLTWTSTGTRTARRARSTINSGRTGPLTGGASGHGGLSPWVVRNTLVLWGERLQGPRARRRARVARRSDADGAEVLGVDPDPCEQDAAGCFEESLRGSPDRRWRPLGRQRRHRAAYRAGLRISSVAGHDYVDEGSRQK